MHIIFVFSLPVCPLERIIKTKNKKTKNYDTKKKKKTIATTKIRSKFSTNTQGNNLKLSEIIKKKQENKQK